MKITESEVESSIVLQLSACGWQLDPGGAERDVFRRGPRTEEERFRLKGRRPGFVLYADRVGARPTLVIEAKKPNASLETALAQGRAEAECLGAPIAVATDGYRLKTWHLHEKTPLFWNNREVDELFGPELANYFAQHPRCSNVAKTSALNERELVGKFESANKILRQEGLEAGMARFSEFAQLMFLKLQLEKGGDIGGYSWDDVVRRKTRMVVVKAMLANLHGAHSALFKQTRIQNSANLEKLVDILSSFELSGIRGDIKGMAFEYFIHSYTQGLKNDLGQYFTPRRIIKMMVDYLNPRLGEKIYDPFCGTGGMLIECFRYIQNRIGGEAERKRLCQDTLYGRDISGAARIAMMNMIMFGDGHSNIEQGDSYRALESGGQYDVVIANIPFSQETEYAEGYPVAPAGHRQSGDSIGVQHCLASLKDDGQARAAIIVPIGFVYKEDMRREREYIARHFCLEQVVELTPKCFNPYTEQQTAALMLRRRAKKTGKTVYYYVKNDGFSQDGYRVPVAGGNDLDLVMEKQGGKAIVVGEADGWKYKKIVPAARSGWRALGDMAEVRKGDAISPKTQLQYTVGGTHPIVMVADLAANHVDYCLDACRLKINDAAVREKKPRLFPKDSLVISSSGKAVLLNHRALLDAPAYLSATVTGIVAGAEVHPYYLFYWLLRWDSENATYDLGYPGLSKSVVESILIPMASAAEQQGIVDKVREAVGYQKRFKAIHRAIVA